jgi:SAM-dependent methyltransferase
VIHRLRALPQTTCEPVDPHLTTIASYNREAEGYAEHYWLRDRMKPQREKFASLLVKPQPVVLDLGCGPGHDAVRMRTTDIRVVGLDESWGMLKAARRRAADLDLVQADFLTGLPFRSGSFAGIWACSSLLHVPRSEFESLLVEVRRVLGLGGVFFMSLMRGQGEEVRTELRPFGEMTRYFSYYEFNEVVHALDKALLPVFDAEGDERWISTISRAS